MSDDSSWPEQNAIDAWLKKYADNIYFPHNQRMELKEAVTKPRLAVQEKLAAANAKVEKLERDAERYKWLREHSCKTDSEGNHAESWSTHSDPESLDDAIDEAIASAQYQSPIQSE